jgi:arginase
MPQLALIGAPTSAGAFAPGQELAPAALRAAGLVEALTARGQMVVDRGDGPFQRWAPDAASPRSQNVDLVVHAIDAIAEAARTALVDTERVLLIGGDCTVGVAAVEALQAVDPSTALLYLDLHADMNTPTSVVDGAIDWMGLGCMLGLEGAVEGIARRAFLSPDRVALVGFGPDQATAWEAAQIERLGLTVFTVDEVARDPAAAARAALAHLPTDASALAVHFDVDLVDFTDAPLSENTGRNIGVTLACALTALSELVGDPRVRVVTITEVNPLHGAADGSTLRRLVTGIADAMASQGHS